MEFRIGLAQLPIFVSFLVSLSVFFVALSRVRVRGMIWMVHLMGALAVWSFAYLLEISSTTVDHILFFSRLTFIGISLVPVFYLLFALSFVERELKFSLKFVLPWLLVVPAWTELVIWNSQLYRYFYAEIRLQEVGNLFFMSPARGPFFWVHTYYSYALLAGGTLILLFLVSRRGEAVRGRALAIVLACLVPLGANLLHVFRILPHLSPIDITPFGFSVSGVLFLYALMRYQVADYIPVTHRLILENLKEAIFVLDYENRLVELNPSAEKLFRYPPSQLIGRPVLDLVAENRELLQQFERVFDDQGEIDLKIRGILHSFEYSISPIRDKRLQEQQGRVIVLRDISDRKQAESQASKAERLDSMELLAGGVAHDFNNLLSGIVGNISLADLENRDPIVAEYLREAENASAQASKLTRQLLSFSSKGCPEPEPSSLKELVTETVGFFLRGSKISSELSIADDLWNIYVDPHQIVQVLNNIVVNTKQALADGGVLKVSATNMELGPGNWLSLEPGSYVHVLLEDNGPGIPEENLLKIFDPYYTTKKEGSGLGLAVAYGVVKNNNGTLFAEAGPGAKFHLYLPALADGGIPSLPGLHDKRALDELKVPGLERLILMDDDRTIRRVVGTILRHMGYSVEVFSDASQVLAALEHDDGGIQAIIADLTVPGGSGAVELLHELRSRGNTLPVIIASGYAEKKAIRLYREYGFAAAILKPFTPQKVHAALAGLSS